MAIFGSGSIPIPASNPATQPARSFDATQRHRLLMLYAEYRKSEIAQHRKPASFNSYVQQALVKGLV